MVNQQIRSIQGQLTSLRGYIEDQSHREKESNKHKINYQHDYSSDYSASSSSMLTKQAPPEGLPNIGNTCFLNSSLQFLYGVDQIRSQIIQNYSLFNKKYRKDNVLSLISQIFTLLQKKEKHRNYTKQIIIEKIISCFESSDYGYKKYLQEDALKIIMAIIDLIDQYASPIKKYFLADILYKCSNCMSGPLLRSSILFSQQQQSCSKCQIPIDKEILSTSQYLLIVSQYDNERKINGFTYELVSKILFKRYSQNYGHYICIRKENGRIYEFDDNTVKDITEIRQERRYSSKYHPIDQSTIRLVLYRKKQ